MTDKAQDNQEKITAIAQQYNTGAITREEAQAAAQPVIDSINEAARRIAKKYNMRPKLVSFMELMR